MNTKALRQKVLDLAIHGKLVPQNPNDEGATVLLEKIRAEKAEKIKKGELKTDKKDSFIFTKECEFDEDKLGKCSSGTRHKRHYEQFADGTVKDIEDEIPFDVPEGWAWCRLNELADIARGGSPRPIENYITDSPDGINWIKIGDTAPESKYIESAKEKIKPEGQKHSRFVHEGDFLLTNSMSFGRPYILKINGCIHDGWLVFANIKECVIKDYLYYALSSDYIYASFSMVAAGSTVKNLKSDTVKQVLFPLPPIKTQEKIVESIEESFSQIDILDNEKSELQTAIKQAKSKILDLAIHGKLVPQDPNDEPAEELLKRIATSDNRPYKKLSGDEIPFELPKTWIWQKLPDLCSIPITDGTHKTPTYSDKENGIPFLSSKDVTSGEIDWSKIKYITKELHEELYKRLAPQKNDILLAKNGTTGIAALVKDNTVFDIYVTLALIRPISKIIYPQYLLYIINSQFCKNQFNDHLTGIGVPNLHLVDINKTVIPLPPLSEQQRIVLKIEELFKYTDIININIKDC